MFKLPKLEDVFKGELAKSGSWDVACISGSIAWPVKTQSVVFRGSRRAHTGSTRAGIIPVLVCKGTRDSTRPVSAITDKAADRDYEADRAARKDWLIRSPIVTDRTPQPANAWTAVAVRKVTPKDRRSVNDHNGDSPVRRS